MVKLSAAKLTPTQVLGNQDFVVNFELLLGIHIFPDILHELKIQVHSGPNPKPLSDWSYRIPSREGK